MSQNFLSTQDASILGKFGENLSYWDHNRLQQRELIYQVVSQIVAIESSRI